MNSVHIILQFFSEISRRVHMPYKPVHDVFKEGPENQACEKQSGNRRNRNAGLAQIQAQAPQKNHDRSLAVATTGLQRARSRES